MAINKVPIDPSAAKLACCPKLLAATTPIMPNTMVIAAAGINQAVANHAPAPADSPNISVKTRIIE